MRCLSCDHDNRPGPRFCTQCGAALPVACPSCGAPAEAGEKFCGGCGAPLQTAAPTIAASPPALEPEAASPASERRQLTVLFCDLVGSTELSGRLDPEDLGEVLRAYQSRVGEEVARFGGHVAQYLGDGIVAYFGYPLAQEDAAERAVRAGLAMVEAVNGLGLPHPLSVRVGIHTGTVVVGEIGEAGRTETVALGETPNVAARIQALAESDTVFLTSATQRLVAGMFVVEERGSHTLKGAREPVVVYRAVQPSGIRGHLALATSRGLTPFVGRAHERDLLLERWERVREGEGQVVLVVGEPGIGKSRLIQQFRNDLAGAPHTWIESAGSPYQTTTPLHVTSEQLRQAFAWSDELAVEERLDALDRALASTGLRPAEAAPLVAPLLGLVPPEGRYPPVLLAPELQRKKLLATIASWTLASARLQPTVLVTEDLHWIDPTTLELLGLLAEQAATAPLLLIVTARPEFRTPWPLRSHHAQLSLNRLTKAQTRQMIAAVASRGAPPESVVDTVVARTDGVPLFVEELARSALEGAAPAAAREIPATLQDILMARLDRLGAAKEVAQIASVIGREFAHPALRAVCPLPEEALRAALEKLVEAELVYAHGLPPDPTYLFKHALVRDAAYESLLKSRRRELHRAIATALETEPPDGVAGRSELLAQHWEGAGDSERAVTAWEQAAESAKNAGALVEAERRYVRALDCLAKMPDTPQRAQRELMLRIPLHLIVDVTHGYQSSESVGTHARISELSRQVGDAQSLIMVLMTAFAPVITRGEPRAALAIADQLLVVAKRDGSPFGLTYAHYMRGVALFALGDLAAATDHAERALGFYRAEDHRWMPTDAGLLARGLLAWTCALRGFGERALHEIDVLLGEDQSVSHRAAAYVMAVMGFHLLRDAPRSIETADILLPLTVDHELPWYSALGRILRGWALAMRGESEDAITHIRQGIDFAVSIGNRATLGRYLGLLAEAQLAAGHIQDGLVTVERALGAAPEERLHIPELLRLRGALRAAGGGDNAPVEADLREAITSARAMGAKLDELRATTSLARFAAQRGHGAEARALLAPICASFTEGFDLRDLIEAKALLAQLR